MTSDRVASPPPYPGRLMHERWLIDPGDAVDLAAVDAGSTGGAPGAGDKASSNEPIDELRHELRRLQGRLWAARQRALLLVLQAMDAGGKDGTIKHVFKGVNPQGTRITSFKQPTEDELEHDFL